MAGGISTLDVFLLCDVRWNTTRFRSSRWSALISYPLSSQHWLMQVKPVRYQNSLRRAVAPKGSPKNPSMSLNVNVTEFLSQVRKNSDNARYFWPMGLLLPSSVLSNSMMSVIDDGGWSVSIKSTEQSRQRLWT